MRKIGIPNHVLDKPDRLTEKEYDVIRPHTTIGYSIHNETTDLKKAARLGKGPPLSISDGRRKGKAPAMYFIPHSLHNYPKR